MPESKFLITWDLVVVMTAICICFIYSHQASLTGL